MWNPPVSQPGHGLEPRWGVQLAERLFFPFPIMSRHPRWTKACSLYISDTADSSRSCREYPGAKTGWFCCWTVNVHFEDLGWNITGASSYGLCYILVKWMSTGVHPLFLGLVGLGSAVRSCSCTGNTGFKVREMMASQISSFVYTRWK